LKTDCAASAQKLRDALCGCIGDAASDPAKNKALVDSIQVCYNTTVAPSDAIPFDNVPPFVREMMLTRAKDRACNGNPFDNIEDPCAV
jgi:hypothetical protein